MIALSTIVPAAAFGATAFLVGTRGRAWLCPAPVAVALAALVGVGLGVLPPRVDPVWAGAGLVWAAGVCLLDGAHARTWLALTGPMLLLSALAAHGPLVSALGPDMGRKAVGVLALLLPLGTWARGVRPRGWFTDAAVFLLLGPLFMVAAPSAVTAWQRAAVAAEGADPVGTAPQPRWPLAIGVVAFGGALGWRLVRA